MSRRASPPPAPTAPRPDHRDAWRAASALVVLALAVRLWQWTRTAGLTMDSPLYVRMAEALLAGERGPSPAHHGYSMLIAAVSWLVPGRELPGRLVSLLASLALPPLVWAIARWRAPAALAFASGALVAAHPLLAVYGVAVMTEASFLALAFAGLLLVDRDRPLAGGALIGAAYWIRPEAAVVAPVAALLARRPRAMALVMLGAALAALPYLGVLRWQQGWWSLTPKTALVRPAFATAADAEWRLADSAAAFADTVDLAARVAASGGGMLASYGPQLANHAARLLEAWPAPLLLLSLSGLAASPGAWLAPVACLFVIPLLAAPDDVRFAQLFVPSLALLAAFGVARFAWPRGRWARAVAVALALAGVAMAWAGPAGQRARAFDDGPMPTLRAAGEWLRERSRPGDLVVDRKAYVPFFAGLPHVQLPDDSLTTIVTWARARGARWLVAEEYVVRSLRPQLEPLLSDPNYTVIRDRRLRLAYAQRTEPGTGVAIFELAPAHLGEPVDGAATR